MQRRGSIFLFDSGLDGRPPNRPHSSNSPNSWWGEFMTPICSPIHFQEDHHASVQSDDLQRSAQCDDLESPDELAAITGNYFAAAAPAQGTRDGHLLGPLSSKPQTPVLWHPPKLPAVGDNARSNHAQSACHFLSGNPTPTQPARCLLPSRPALRSAAPTGWQMPTEVSRLADQFDIRHRTISDRAVLGLAMVCRRPNDDRRLCHLNAAMFELRQHRFGVQPLRMRALLSPRGPGARPPKPQEKLAIASPRTGGCL